MGRLPTDAGDPLHHEDGFRDAAFDGSGEYLRPTRREDEAHQVVFRETEEAPNRRLLADSRQ